MHRTSRAHVDIAPLIRAARAGGPLTRALVAVGHHELAAFLPPTHDDQILGGDGVQFSAFGPDQRDAT